MTLENTQTASRKMMAYIGLILVGVTSMFLICGVGVYAYAVCQAFDSVAQIGLVFTLESIFRTVTIPIAGKIGDLLGRKKVFLFALALYIVTVIVSGFSTNFWVFLIARTISGLAWGLYQINIFVMIADIFGQDRAPKYSGFVQSLYLAVTMASAPICGILCNFSWRMVYYVAIPLLVLGFIFCLVAHPKTMVNQTASQKMNVGSCIATALFLAPVCLAMNWGNTYGWTSPLILALFAITVVGAIILVFTEKKSANPIYPLRLLTNKYFLCCFALSFLMCFYNGAGQYYPSYAQAVLGASSTLAGFINTPGLLVSTVLTAYLGNYAAKRSKYRGMIFLWVLVALLGGAIAAFVPGSIVAKGATFGIALIFVAQFFMASVNGVEKIVCFTYPMKVVKPEELAAAMAFLNLAGPVGATVASGVCGGMMSTPNGMDLLFYTPVVLAVIMLIPMFLFRDRKQSDTI